MLKITNIYGWNLRSDYKNSVKITLHLFYKIYPRFLFLKVANSMDMVKIAKLTKINGGNPAYGLERGLQLFYIYLIRYIKDF